MSTTNLRNIGGSRPNLMHLQDKSNASFKSSFRSFQALTAKKKQLDVPLSHISNVTLKYTHEKMESDFHAFYLKESLKKAQYTVALVFLVELLSVSFDFWFIYRQDLQLADAWPLILMRLLVVILFGLVGLFSIWKRSHDGGLQNAIAVASFFSLCIFLGQNIFICELVGTDDMAYGLYFMAHSCLLIMYTFTFSTLRFLQALACGATFCMLTWTLLAFETDSLLVCAIFFLLSALTAVMSFISYNLERFIRKRFELIKSVEEKREKIELEKSLSQGLLLNIFPKVIIEKFKRDKATIVEEFSEVTMFFSDIVSFTEISSTKTPIQLVNLLNDMFSRFDNIVAKYKLEKIKTIGDAYMAVGGLPITTPDHAMSVANMSIEVLEAVKEFNQKNKRLLGGREWNIRVGLHTGRVVAGVIGKKKYLYDLYGDSVTIAALMEQSGQAGKVHISETTFQHIKGSFTTEEAQEVYIKGANAMMRTYFLTGKLDTDQGVPNVVAEDPQAAEHEMARLPALSLSIANPIWKHLNQEIEDLMNIKLHRITLAFPLPEIEKEFQRYFFRKNLQPMRVAVLMMVAFVLLLEFFDPVGGFLVEDHFTGIVFAHIANFFLLKPYFKYGIFLAAAFQVVFLISAAIRGILDLIGVMTVLFGVFCYGLVANYMFERYLRITFVNEKLLEMEAERLSIEQAKSEELLVNLLPESVAAILKTGEQTIASRFPNVTIMFVHIVGLSKLQETWEMKELFKLVNTIFCKFDDITDAYRIEKIKTIGSSYMVASGIEEHSDSREALQKDVGKVIEAAIAMMDYINEFNKENRRRSIREDSGPPVELSIRVGIHNGPVVAGVIGKKKFAYDLWGDCVNVASRMESNSVPGHIQVTERIYQLMADEYHLEERGEMDIKGKGKMKTFFLLHRKKKTGDASPGETIHREDSIPTVKLRDSETYLEELHDGVGSSTRAKLPPLRRSFRRVQIVKDENGKKLALSLDEESD